MTLTYYLDKLSPCEAERMLHYGQRNGNMVVIDALDVLRPWCPRCGGEHKLRNCPIPPDTSPEKEKKKAKQGGCCGEPSEKN